MEYCKRQFSNAIVLARVGPRLVEDSSSDSAIIVVCFGIVRDIVFGVDPMSEIHPRRSTTVPSSVCGDSLLPSGRLAPATTMRIEKEEDVVGLLLLCAVPTRHVANTARLLTSIFATNRSALPLSIE